MRAKLALAVALLFFLVPMPLSQAAGGPGTPWSSSPNTSNIPAGCSSSFSDGCYHMRGGLNALDSPKIDVLLIVPASMYAERDLRAMHQVVDMYDAGIDYIATTEGMSWLADGVEFHVTPMVFDPVNGNGGEFSTYPLVDPEIVIFRGNPFFVPVGLGAILGIGIDPLAPNQAPCHNVQNPFDIQEWEAVPGFDSHHDGRSGTYVEDCDGAGGNVCFAINGGAEPVPDLDLFGINVFDLVAHEFGHCLRLGHVGDAGDHTTSAVPYTDIMSYAWDGTRKCVSSLDVEGFAVAMSPYLDVNGDDSVTSADRLYYNDKNGNNGADGSPFQVQHPDDHYYASESGAAADCPQPDLGITPLGEPVDFYPGEPTPPNEPFVDITAPTAGQDVAADLLTVTGTVDRNMDSGEPVATLSASPSAGAPPLDVTFTMGATDDGSIASWSLDFGDGSAAASGTGAPPATQGHTYASGAYEATLTVVDDEAKEGSASAAVVASASGPYTVTDASDDGKTDFTELLQFTADTTATTLDVEVSVQSLPPGGVTATSPTSYSLFVDGNEFQSFVRYPIDPNPMTWDVEAAAYLPAGSSAWDLTANTVTFHLPFAYLSGHDLPAPWALHAVGNVGLLSNVVADDRVPDTGSVLLDSAAVTGFRAVSIAKLAAEPSGDGPTLGLIGEVGEVDLSNDDQALTIEMNLPGTFDGIIPTAYGSPFTYQVSFQDGHNVDGIEYRVTFTYDAVETEGRIPTGGILVETYDLLVSTAVDAQGLASLCPVADSGLTGSFDGSDSNGDGRYEVVWTVPLETFNHANLPTRAQGCAAFTTTGDALAAGDELEAIVGEAAAAVVVVTIGGLGDTTEPGTYTLTGDGLPLSVDLTLPTSAETGTDVAATATVTGGSGTPTCAWSSTPPSGGGAATITGASCTGATLNFPSQGSYSVTVNVNSGAATDTATIAVADVVEPTEHVELYLDSETSPSDSIDVGPTSPSSPTDTWSGSVDLTGAASGTHTITAKWFEGTTLIDTDTVTVTIGATDPCDSDTSAPVITDVAVAADRTSAIVSWTTDEASSGVLRYGSTATYTEIREGDPGVTSHAIEASPLDPGATYHFSVESEDGCGYAATTADATFATPDGVVDVSDGESVEVAMEAGQEAFFRIAVPAGHDLLSIAMTGPACDPPVLCAFNADLYVNPDAIAGADDALCASNGDTSDEFCDIVAPDAASWYALVHAFEGSGTVTVTFDLDLADLDGDGSPDVRDSDRDGDLLANDHEDLLGSDPDDGSSPGSVDTSFCGPNASSTFAPKDLDGDGIPALYTNSGKSSDYTVNPDGSVSTSPHSGLCWIAGDPDDDGAQRVPSAPALIPETTVCGPNSSSTFAPKDFDGDGVPALYTNSGKGSDYTIHEDGSVTAAKHVGYCWIAGDVDDDGAQRVPGSPVTVPETTVCGPNSSSTFAPKDLDGDGVPALYTNSGKSSDYTIHEDGSVTTARHSGLCWIAGDPDDDNVGRLPL
ncbi:MAG: PKD domain-containing protein [Thermoplasmatota archaeon]